MRKSYVITLILLILIGCREDDWMAKSLITPPRPDLTEGGGDGGGGGGSKKEITTSDSFVAPPHQSIDFLFTFDNSGSMDEERKSVYKNMGAFQSILEAKKFVSYQMAVTDTDAFSHQGALISSANGTTVVTNGANSVTEFQAIITELNQLVGKDKSYWEQGLEASYMAIQNHGTEFMRTGTPLAVVIMTDEQDYSCENCTGILLNSVLPENISPQTWTHYPESRYVTYFKNLKANENSSVLFYPIVGVPAAPGSSQKSCSEIQSLGTRYINVQSLMGTGFVGSICDNTIDQSFLNIAQTIVDRGLCFALTKLAIDDPLKFNLKVSGSLTSYSQQSGFYYDKPTNSICFSGSFEPASGSSIVVDYFTLSP